MFLWEEQQKWPRFMCEEHGRTHTLPLRWLGLQSIATVK